jgi:hypothetical protein
MDDGLKAVFVLYLVGTFLGLAGMIAGKLRRR